MAGPTTLDGAVVRRLFDSTTFARGWSYAVSHAVLDYSCDPEGDFVAGEVQGQAAYPYDVEVTLARSAAGTVVTVDGECSCPVAYNCKHVAALLLASGAATQIRPPAKRVAARRPARPLPARKAAPGQADTGRGAARGQPKAAAWEKTLAAVSDGLVDAAAGVEPELALQFQVVTNRRSANKNVIAPGIEVRPVVRSPSGNWVRTGTSWSTFDYSFSPTGARAERHRLLRELHLVARLSSGSGSFGYSAYSHRHDAPLWLEEVSSRRLWDLLAQAEELGIPLVSSGARGGPIRLVPGPAAVGADLVADGEGLRMTAFVEADGERVPPGSSVLIGPRPHGVAWWREAEGTEGSLQLAMAPFSRELSRGEQALLEKGTFDVPGRHRERFLRDYYPSLARSVAVVASDQSVDLPEVPRLQLVLWVRHRGTSCVATWQRGVQGSPARESLWTGTERVLERELDTVVAEATRIVRALPAMVEDDWRGERLAPEAELSGMGAVRFVTELLPALSQLPGLVVEEEGEAPDYREAAGAPVVSLRAAGRDFDGDWFDLSVEVTVDGEQVVFQELFVALAEGHSHLVLPSGTYFPLDRAELAELAELIAEARAMQDRDTADADHIRLSRFQAGLWEDLRRLGVLTAQAEAWEDAVRSLAEGGSDIPVDPPAALQATLRPYQHEGFAWLAFLHSQRLGGILADDMGLGKTLQALSLICHARQEKPYLVVAPTSVVENWARECSRFAPDLAVATISETEARRWVSLSDLADKSDVVITSYTLFRLEYDAYERIEWAGLFLDEAQFVKNPRSIAHQKAKTLPAPFKVAMTGTPIENNLKELWALLSITAPGLFPRPDRFAEQYAVPIEKKGDGERLAQLRRRVRPLMLRRTKEQVESELPDKQEQVLELDLAPRHRRLYQTHLQRERQKILGLLGDMDRHQFEILRSLTLLRQAAIDVSLVDQHCEGVPSTKLDALMEMLGEIVSDGHRVLVFSQFTRFLSKAARRAGAEGIEHCYLDGRTRKRDKVIAEFRDGSAPVFFISLKAGGFGLNLTEADYCILLDPWWNPATEAQAVDRAHRIGQTRKVMVYRLVSKDTIEEKVMALKAKKAALFASVMDAGGFESAHVSAADIRALLD